MLFYFIVFTVIGFVIGFLPSKRDILFTIVVIAGIWGLLSKPIWGFVAGGELLLGAWLAAMLIDYGNKSNSELNEQDN